MKVVLLKLMTQVHKKAGTNFDTNRKLTSSLRIRNSMKSMIS